MSTPPSTPTSIDLPITAPKKGISMDTIVKLIGLFIVIYIIYAVWHIFRGIKSDPGWRAFTETFENIAAALAWASSHWELILAAYLLAPMVPAAAKWAAEKMAAVEKKGVEPKAKEKLVDMITYKAKEQLEKSPGTSEAERAEAKASKEAAAKDYERGQEEEDKKAREEAERVASEPGVDIPKIPEKALQRARFVLQQARKVASFQSGPQGPSGTFMMRAQNGTYT